MSLENVGRSPLGPVAGPTLSSQAGLEFDVAAEMRPALPGTPEGAEPQEREVARRIQAAKSAVWDNYMSLFNWSGQNPAGSTGHPDTAH